jgi:hypothetical protein
MHRDYHHARSLDSKYNFTRAWLARLHGTLRFELPEHLKFVGEYCWGKHSIFYPDNHFDGYFQLFSVFEQMADGRSYSLSYDKMVEWSELLDLPTPKVLYRGVFDEKILRELSENIDTNLVEGYVVRSADGFYREYSNQNLAKWVREGHVQPNSKHWLKEVIQNGKLSKNVKPYFMK